MTTEPAWVCTECETPLRPARKTAKELPGTHPHAANGLCRACYDKQYRARRKATRDAENAMTKGIRPEDKGISAGFDVNHARYALASFMSNLPSRKSKAAA